MTKLRNKIVLVLLALCLVAFAGLTVACGGDDKKPENKPVTYTVTVKMDNEPVKGVKVTVKKGGVSYAPKTTGDDGKVEFSLAESKDYVVELDNLPENYEVPADATLTFPTDRNLTVNLAEKFAYKVNLVDKDGAPFTLTDVEVQICTADGTNCLEGVAVDATGSARIETAKGNYHIKVNGLPVGYAYECDGDGYAMHQSDEGTYIYAGNDNTYNSLSETVTEQTIKIYQVTVLDFGKMTAMTDNEIAEYNDAYRTITGAKAYKVQATVPAGATVHYAFNAECAGKYNLYAVGFDQSLVGYKINPQFLLGENSAPNSGWTFMYYQGFGYVEAVNGKQYYVSITAKDAQLELEFILTTPVASAATVTGAGTVNVTLNRENATAVIELKPTIGAAFKATVQGDTVAAIASSDYEISENEMYDVYGAFGDDSFGAGKYCEFKFTEDKIGRSVYLAVCAKAEQYPVTVSVKIEKTADVHNTINDITTTDTLAKYNRPTGNKELVPVPLDGTAEELVLGQDGYYHYGADGPVVMVILTEALDDDRFGGGAVAYMEYYTNGWVNPYVIDVTPSEDVADLTKGKTYNDYRVLLRGFKNYKSTEQILMIIPDPDDITVEKYYAKYVNEDGAYPLTENLKGILQAITEELNYTNFDMLPDGDFDSMWMFACYYYDDYVEPDAIVGEYKFVTKVEDGERISVGDQEAVDWDADNNPTLYKNYTADTYKLVIERRHKFAIYELNADEEYEEYGDYKGTWVKNSDGAYTFTVSVKDWDEEWNVIYTDWTLSATYNETTGAFTLVAEDGTEWGFTNKPAQTETDPIVGDYSTEDGAFTLSVSNNKQFTIMETDVGEYTSGTWRKNGDTYTFTIPDDVFESVLTYSDGEFSFTDFYNEEPLVFKKAEQSETDEIVGEYAPDEMNPNQDHLIVDADGTYSWGTASGTWSKNADDDYYTFNNAAGQPQYTADFTGESVLLFAYGDDPSDYDNWPVAELFVVGEEEDDGEPDFADLYSDEKIQQDETIAQARLGLYDGGKCVLWQFSFRSQTYEKIATATWGAEEDGSNVTISGITVVEGYVYEITANYAQGVVTVTLHMDGVDEDTVYTFDMTQQA